MRCFVFEFYRLYETIWIEKSFYAEDEVEAWKKADELAFFHGYSDYRLRESF